MKLPVIKKLAELHSLEELQAAESAMYEEIKPAIDVEGADEGEKLTHILGALWVKEALTSGSDLTTALREYAQKVRNSIS